MSVRIDQSSAASLPIEAGEWDIVFFLNGYPPELRFHDAHYFMADLGEDMLQKLRDIGDPLPEDVMQFFRNSDPKTVIGFRLKADSERSALQLAKHQLDGFIDGISIIRDRDLPKICSLIHVRQLGQFDARLVISGEPTWIYVQSKNADSVSMWKERCEKVFEALNPFLDVAAGVHPRAHTSLSRQLLYSMKMYRHGAATGVYGLEFICKWSALEGLVCGSEREKKRALLVERVPALFPATQVDTEKTVNELWKFRSEAVHEALAFHTEHLSEGRALALHIEDIERLFLAVITFALDNLSMADTIKGLWKLVDQYTLPSFATQKRPLDMQRYCAVSYILETNLRGKGFGLLNDAAFEITNLQRQEKHASP